MYLGLGQEVVDVGEDVGVDAGVGPGQPHPAGLAHSEALPLQTDITPGTGLVPQPAHTVQRVVADDCYTRQTNTRRVDGIFMGCIYTALS